MANKKLRLSQYMICVVTKGNLTFISTGCIAYNLRTGSGTSVLEMVAAFEKASGKKIPIKLCPRRLGDATAVYASTEKAQKELGWKDVQRLMEVGKQQSTGIPVKALGFN
ncbi:hypothetical protein CXB51_021406 [Gossypium anomalum]|uniref:NAD(P)-binding domain-containing protein n=1 Tax=Gossypium anomalum TaxID=47600 RepID=A0A8J5YH98_9ROSI|nr:hypothetical protein CXB51_021406 [Gossypium anomalum]